MKFTLANLLLAMLLLATVLAWWLDRRELSQENAKQQLRNSASFRIHGGIWGLYTPHDEEFKLRDILTRYDLDNSGVRKSSMALQVLAVHRSYAEIEDKKFADSYVQLALLVNGWETADDLMDALKNQRRLTENPNTLDELDVDALSQYLKRISASLPR